MNDKTIPQANNDKDSYMLDMGACPDVYQRNNREAVWVINPKINRVEPNLTARRLRLMRYQIYRPLLTR
jgi:hypothetical protein